MCAGAELSSGHREMSRFSRQPVCHRYTLISPKNKTLWPKKENPSPLTHWPDGVNYNSIFFNRDLDLNQQAGRLFVGLYEVSDKLMEARYMLVEWQRHHARSNQSSHNIKYTWLKYYLNFRVRRKYLVFSRNPNSFSAGCKQVYFGHQSVGSDLFFGASALGSFFQLQMLMLQQNRGRRFQICFTGLWKQLLMNPEPF